MINASSDWDVYTVFPPIHGPDELGAPVSSRPPEIILDRARPAHCHLGDDEASTQPCALCWITSGKSDGGRVKFGGCPPEISMQWDQEPPKLQMYADVDYEVAYSVRIGAGLRPWIVKQDNVHLPHTNIHSCLPTAGVCTPFIQNTSGLATHTAELKGDLDADGTAHFKSNINLPESHYTIIAHARFFVPSASCPAEASLPDCLDKIDMAIGRQRRVIKAPPKASAEARTGSVGERDDNRQQIPASVAVVPSGPP